MTASFGPVIDRVNVNQYNCYVEEELVDEKECTQSLEVVAEALDNDQQALAGERLTFLRYKVVHEVGKENRLSERIL